MIREIKVPKYQYIFTCERCQSHTFINYTVTNAKCDGGDIGHIKFKVCKQCRMVNK